MLIVLYINFLPLDVVVMLPAFRVLKYANDLLLIASTRSDLHRMTKICEDEMKWLDICFKMAVSANWVIPGPIGLNPQKTAI